MNQHTKGPWHLETGEFYCAVRTEHQVIANMRFVGGCYNKRDATLIAAAPELLAVLQELAESAEYWSEYDVPVGIVDRINDAIAKAGGES